MRKKHIENILQKADELSTTTKNLLNTLSQFEDSSNQAFDLKKPIRGTDSSTAQIVSRISIITDMIAKFDKAIHVDLVPVSVLTGLQKEIENTTASTKSLIDNINGLKKSQGGLHLFDYSAFNAQMNSGHTQNFQAVF